MTALTLAASLIPVLAAGELDTILNVVDAGTTIGLLVILVKAFWTGSIRRKDEVEAADARTAAEKLRADREAESRQRIQEAVLKEQGLAAMELSTQGKELVRSATRIQDRMEKLVDTFLELLRKVIER